MFFFQSQNRKNHCVRNTPKSPTFRNLKALCRAKARNARGAMTARAAAAPARAGECEEAAPDVATTALTHWFCPLAHPQSRDWGDTCILHTKCPPCLSGGKGQSAGGAQRRPDAAQSRPRKAATNACASRFNFRSLSFEDYKPASPSQRCSCRF